MYYNLFDVSAIKARVVLPLFLADYPFFRTADSDFYTYNYA